MKIHLSISIGITKEKHWHTTFSYDVHILLVELLFGFRNLSLNKNLYLRLNIF